MTDKKHSGSIFLSLVIFTALIIIVNIFTVLFINLFFTDAYYMNDLRKYMKEQNEAIIEHYDRIEDYNPKYEIYNMRLELYDTETNRITYSTIPQRTSIQISGELSREGINDIFENVLNGQQYVILIQENESYHTISSLLDNDEDQIIMFSKKSDNHYFALEIPSPAIVNASSLLKNFVLLASAASMLIMIPLIIFFSYLFTKPIREIYKTTNQIKQLNFDKKCDVHSKNELGVLAESINSMADSMQKYICEINSKNDLLKKDIEVKTKMEDAQKKFISDASHEFKTPISIISVYAEGIKVGMTENKEETDEYCDIIISECQRMTAITKRLLYLSNLESSTYKLNISTFDIADMARREAEKFSLKCHQGDTEISVGFDDNFKAMIEADRDEIEKVILNYLSNACKYCSKPGKIKIEIKDEDEWYHISVYNNGKHIHETDKIWNRFYREDKARTRDEESTGLGLAIVKAAMELHGMPYGFENKPGGVEFFIKLKKHPNNI